MHSNSLRVPVSPAVRRESTFGLAEAMDSFRSYDTWRLSRYLKTGDPSRGGMLKLNGATLLHFMDVGYFNRVYDFGIDNVVGLGAFQERYRKRWVLPRRFGVSLVAKQGFDLEDVGEALAVHGFEPTTPTARLGLNLASQQARASVLGASSTSAGDLQEARGGSEERSWFEFRQPVVHEYDSVLDLYLNGFQAPIHNHRAAKHNMIQLFDQPELVTWCAFDQGIPVALGMLFMKPPIGVLVAGVTSPAYQQRGVHEALIQLRISHAKAFGCQRLYSWADADGQSCRNLMAQGFELLRIDTVWRQRSEC